MTPEVLFETSMTRPYIRLMVVFVLGFSSGLPMALLGSTLLAWFAVYGHSVISVASLSLLGLPYIFRVLWSPLLDRYYFIKIGKRRSWLIASQIVLFTGLYLCSFLTPAYNPIFIAALALALSFVSATQDAVIDAHRTEYIEPRWHALAASLAVTAYRCAILVSGGFALIVAQHWGWARMFQIMAICFILPLLVSFFSREPQHPPSPAISLQHAFYRPFKELIARPYCVSLIVFIVCYKLGEAFTSTTSGIMMPFLVQGIGFPLETIAYVNKVIGVFAIIAGGLIAGIILLRASLYRALFLFGLLQAVTNGLFVLLAIAGANIPLFIMAVISDNLAAGMGSTALVALIMRVVDRRYTATQFSLLVAISSIPRVFSGPFAGWLQSGLGWTGLYMISVLLALIFIPFLKYLKNVIESKSVNT